jgi:hypothetical protein
LLSRCLHNDGEALIQLAAPDPKKWRYRLATRKTFVAELDGTVVGFAELGANGNIDALYATDA